MKINKLVKISLKDGAAPTAGGRNYKITPATPADFNFEEMDVSDYSYKHNIDQFPVVLEKDKEFNISNISGIKKYYFVPGTVFDRDYFKRLYPDLVYTRKIENADIVIYDNASYRAHILFSLKTTGYGYTSLINDTLYDLGEYSCSRYLSAAVDPVCQAIYKAYSYKQYYFYKATIDKKFDNKLISIDKLFNNMKSDLLIGDLKAADATVFLTQAISDNIGTKKAAIESLLNYEGFNISKKIIISLCGTPNKIGSSKLNYFIKGKNLYYRGCYNDTLFNFVSQISKDYDESKDEKDKEIVISIINSKEFQRIWTEKTTIPFSLVFNIKKEEIISGASEFIL